MNFDLLERAHSHGQKIEPFFRKRMAFLKGFRLGLASLPLFFVNFGHVHSSAIKPDGIASDWQQVGDDLRNAFKKELNH
jgi:hypothetical protein